MDYGDGFFLSPWRCSECKQLMYCIDGEGKPTPGAPIGLAITMDSGDRKRVCTMCAEIYIAAHESKYMLSQHKMWMAEQQRRREKLGVKGSYLDSDN